MKINEHLKFSWGHIIAFLAIIFISYISFLGLSYLTNGKFLMTGLGVAVVDIVLLCIFIGAQMLKASDHHFNRRIHFERALVFLSPLVFIVVLYPFSHYWSVYDNRSKIESDFSNTITDAKQLFNLYEDYSQERIESLELALAGSKSRIHSQNIIEALSLQLIGDNYTNLRKASYEWISSASKATVWNVFMIGNIETITDAFTSWNQSLVEFSNKQLSEESKVIRFDANNENVSNIARGFISIKRLYSQKNWPNSYTWLQILFLYCCLLLPYLIQDRHTKSTKRLFGNTNRAKHENKEERSIEEVEIVNGASLVPEMETPEESDFVEIQHTTKKTKVVDVDEDEDDYGSFTM